VTGCVYNGRNKVPYKLPDNKTVSTFRTDTHQGEGFNELRFEDERGQEEVMLRAQKDLTIKVENHATERVDANKVVSVGGAALTEVTRSDTTNVGQNMTLNIGTGPGGDAVRGGLTADEFGIREAGYFVQRTMPTMTGRGNFLVNAAGSVVVNAAMAATQTVGGANMVNVGLAHSLIVGGAIFASSGQNSDEVVQQVKTIDAHAGILLRSGASELHMAPDGTVRIKGKALIVEAAEKTKVTSGRIDLN
jgi:type VI secretion system secreted protein VgrG